MVLNLVYVHIGNELPECFLDNLYQMSLMNYLQIKVHILLDDKLIAGVKEQTSKFNHIYFNKTSSFDMQFVFIRNSLIEKHLENNGVYNMYKTSLKRFNLQQFRNGFWVSTTKRFFYLWALMDLFYLERVFHIENDVVLFENLNNVYDDLVSTLSPLSKLIVVRDAPNRVIPSIIYIPDVHQIADLIHNISSALNKSDHFLNDMDLLAKYTNCYTFNVFPSKNSKYLFDGAAIGQYIDGTDIRNLPNLPPVDSYGYKYIQYNNPTCGFINETSVYKPNVTTFYKRPLNIDNLIITLNVVLAKTESQGCINIVPNVHVHSKQLYKFSSVFDMKFNDIISGDRIVGMCDYVISTHQINEFHKNLGNFIKMDRIILIKDFNNINYNALNSIFKGIMPKKVIKLFIYTHLMSHLIKVDFFTKLDTNFEYILYLHNSDHSFDESCKNIITLPHIKKVYTQNVALKSSKVHLLPIGLANCMWPHGDMIQFYDVMKSNYIYKKTDSIYININENTFGYRKIILDTLKENKWVLSNNKPYREYLNELSSHYFCLCIRGNGIDTHRFWESLYMGVIPVLINNEHTDCQVFIDLLNEIGIPFYEIRKSPDDFFKNVNGNDFFNETLYKKIITRIGSSIQNLRCLKLEYYNQN